VEYERLTDMFAEAQSRARASHELKSVKETRS
jgi:hypothetical protein